MGLFFKHSLFATSVYGIQRTPVLFPLSNKLSKMNIIRSLTKGKENKVRKYTKSDFILCNPVFFTVQGTTRVQWATILTTLYKRYLLQIY